VSIPEGKRRETAQRMEILEKKNGNS
jgi:hypothetical protein